jgi:hypothetical protein
VLARVTDLELVTHVELRVSEAARGILTGVATMTGIVSNAEGAPLPATSVEVIGVMGTTTDSAGRFRLSGLSPGTYLVRFRRIGLAQVIKSIPLAAGEEVTADVRLNPSAQDLAPVVVRAQAQRTYLTDPTGFEVRRQSGLGIFLTMIDIESRRPDKTDQLMRTFPGVRVDGAGVVWVDRGRQTILDLQAGESQFTTCVGVQVLIDGTVVPQPFNVNTVPVNAIRGLEFYSGPATTPPELRTPKTNCGTLVIWTR